MATAISVPKYVELGPIGKKSQFLSLISTGQLCRVADCRAQYWYRNSVRPSVHLSVRPSHADILLKHQHRSSPIW